MNKYNNITSSREPNSPLQEAWKRLKRNKPAVISLIVLLLLGLIAFLAPYLAPYSPNEGDMSLILKGPGPAHLMGTDELGRDLFSRVIFGARISLKVGFSAVFLALFLGIILGSIAGYYGGIIDNMIMRVMDVMLAFPSILLAILLMSVLGKGIITTVLAIGIVSIPGFSRIVRGSVLKIKSGEYVQAARAIGCNDGQVIFKHILPNILAPIIINTTMSISGAILYTAALGFLGLGVKPPQAEWGSMLAKGQNYIFNAQHVILFPGLAIFITVLAFNMFGDGLRDALDPKQ